METAQVSFNIGGYKNIWNTHTYYSALIKGHSAFSDDMDESGGYYTKWNKPDMESTAKSHLHVD